MDTPKGRVTPCPYHVPLVTRVVCHQEPRAVLLLHPRAAGVLWAETVTTARFDLLLLRKSININIRNKARSRETAARSHRARPG